MQLKLWTLHTCRFHVEVDFALPKAMQGKLYAIITSFLSNVKLQSRPFYIVMSVFEHIHISKDLDIVAI